ncbi:MAG: hypothetical protein HWN65_12130 [Candidatus Helarchaeota archaeon]|nr:hypothetical protein [Candidatus Helarchaeota archaeon]
MTQYKEKSLVHALIYLIMVLHPYFEDLLRLGRCQALENPMDIKLPKFREHNSFKYFPNLQGLEVDSSSGITK